MRLLKVIIRSERWLHCKCAVEVASCGCDRLEYRRPSSRCPWDVPVSPTAASDTGVESDPDCSGADDRRDPELPIATGRGGAGVSWQRASLTKPAD